MSGYRRGPNVSQYIASLNNMDTSPTSEFLADDLGQFDFSTEFFDFDMGQTIPPLPAHDTSSLEPDGMSGSHQAQSNQDFLNSKPAPNPPHPQTSPT